MKVLTVDDKVSSVGNENEPTVVVEVPKPTKEELNSVDIIKVQVESLDEVEADEASSLGQTFGFLPDDTTAWYAMFTCGTHVAVPLRNVMFSSSPRVSWALFLRGCPLGVSRVTDSLYVCGAHALPGAVRALRPGLIVSAAPELPPPPEDYVPRHFVPLLDTPSSDMHPFMDRVANLINEVVESGEVVLVHCVAGVSRSVTLCLAYLVKWQKMSLRDAYHHMKQRRPQIRPNTGFWKQLIKYEDRLFGEASVKMVYCEAIDKEIPDVYEPDYRGMTWFRQRYGPIEKC